MSGKYFVLIDDTEESQAPFFANKPIFQTLLRSYHIVSVALEFLNSIEIPYCVEVYVSRDSLFTRVQSLAANGQAPTLIETLEHIPAVSHVNVYSPNIDNDLQTLLRPLLQNMRLLKDVFSVVDLHGYMCLKGIDHFRQEITRCSSTQEVHLTTILQQNEDDLWEYFNGIKAKQRLILEALRDQHSDKPGVQES